MSLDPVSALAFSVHANPGVYAVLLGSGASRGAKVPTGWEIMEDLARRVAVLKGEDVEADPVRWYQHTTGRPADYSEMLEVVAPSPVERRNLLHGYFEPDAEEREIGLKVPTEGHHALARLVSSGHIRVIVTTNFDRLTEQALSEAGLQPTVISTEDAAQGAVPLIHNPVTVVKLHGDYLDTRIRNTHGELAEYGPKMTELLDRILDEFGLVICGWSGDWDPALRGALERRRSRRYPLYWTHREGVSLLGQRLADLVTANLITIEGFDSFLTSLENRVAALAKYDRQHPLSKQTAIAELKRYLLESRHRIRMNDLVSKAIDAAYVKVEADELTSGSATQRSGQDEVRFRARKFEAAIEPLLPLQALCAFWDEGQCTQLCIRAVEQIAPRRGPQSGLVALVALRRYPSLLLLYAGGVASMVGRRYGTLNAITTSARFWDGRERVPMIMEMNVDATFQDGAAKVLVGASNRKTPGSDYLHETLWPALSEVAPSQVEYDEAFDRCEAMFALLYVDQHLSRGDDDLFWAPVGRFVWKQPDVAESLVEDLELILDAGCFGGSKERLDAAREKLKELTDKGYGFY